MTSTDDQQQNSTIDASIVNEHSHSCTDPTHNHDLPTYFDQNDLFSTLTGTKTQQQVPPAKRKSKKNRQQNTVRAETIPGNRGNENIDDLVNFINSSSTTTTNDKKQKKKSTTTTTANN